MLQMAPEFFSHNPKRLIAFLLFCAVLCLVAQSCPTICDPMNYSLPGCSVYGDSPGKNTGVGCHVLLQGIFPTQGSNPGLLHHRLILYHLSRQGSPFCSPTYSKMQKARLVPFLPQLCNQLFLLWTPFSFFLKKKIIIYFFFLFFFSIFLNFIFKLYNIVLVSPIQYLKSFKKNNYLLWLLWVFIALCGLSLVAAREGYFL